MFTAPALHLPRAASKRARRDAQRLADDLERKAERQRHGLEPLHEEAPPMTFGELFDWWLREYAAHQRSDNERFYRKRLLPGLAKLPLQEVSPARLEGLLQAQTKDGLSPKSVNELRGAVYTLFRRATQRGLWRGMNPAAGVEKRKVPRKLYDTLRAEEVPLLLAALKPHWRPVFATAVWTGLRKGELLGLRKSDVDMVAGTIAVRRSYDADTTKAGTRTWFRSPPGCGLTWPRRCSPRAASTSSLMLKGTCARGRPSSGRSWRGR